MKSHIIHTQCYDCKKEIATLNPNHSKYAWVKNLTPDDGRNICSDCWEKRKKKKLETKN